MKANRLFLFFFFIPIISFQNKMKADLIVHNAKIYTVDEDFSLAEAFAISNGKIISIGKSDEILEKYQSENIIDAEGKTILPGIHDPHCHFYGYGMTLNRVNLVGTNSFDEVLEMINEFEKTNKSNWILGRGWDQNDWKIQEFPSNERLNELFPEKPLLLRRIDGHAALANQKALELAGITTETKVEGGAIEVKNGKLTGILIDNAVDLVLEIIPKPNENEIKEALLKAQKNCFEVGLTSVSDAGLDKEIILAIDELQKSNQLKMRVYAMCNPSEENLNHFIKNGKYITDKLTVCSVKLYGDGALGSRGAFLIDPYHDHEETKGFMLSDTVYFKKWAKICDENNFQLNTHCIGDGANRILLDIYADFLKGKNDKRWRIEHAQVVHPDDFSKFGKFNIVPSIQTTHATSDMYWADERLGKQRIKNAYAYKNLLKENGWLPNGSDFPVESINPIFGFHSAVARQDAKNFPENGFQMENALTRQEALKAMTIWAAKSNFEEKEKGSLEIGKKADFVILNKDIMEVSLNKIRVTKVLATFIGGEMVFKLVE